MRKSEGQKIQGKEIGKQKMTDCTLTNAVGHFFDYFNRLSGIKNKAVTTRNRLYMSMTNKKERLFKPKGG